MMKTKYILSFLIFFYVSLKAQDTYRILFDLQDFSIENTDGALSINSVKHDCFLLGDTLSPALPYMTYNILRPENGNSANFEVQVKKEKLFENVFIYSNPKEIMIGAVNADAASESVGTLASKSVLNPCLFAGDHCLKGYSFASFNITPFVYDAVLKELSFISEMTITIRQVTANRQYNNKSRKTIDKEDILNKVINPQDFSRFYSNISLRTTSLSDNVEFLIVTTNDLAESFKSLIAWKIQKGIRSEIITTDDIYTSYDGNTQQLKIKNCLLDYYQNKGLKWVLLGGDDTLVPVQRCYAIVNNTTEDSRIPTDLFYACFDNAFDWDANKNSIMGEVEDNIDLYPEIYVSRLPVRNCEDVNAFIYKLLAYERQATNIPNATTLLLAGTQLWDWPNNPLNQSDAHQKSEKMYNDYIAPYWNATKNYFYDTGTSFVGDASYDLTALNLQEQITNGYHFIHMATHGSALTWSMEQGSSFNTNNASSVQNENATIIVTMACTTNAFDDAIDPCLSEAFIRNPNSSCLAYFGGSRSGWGYSRQATLGTSFLYDAYFFKKLFTGEPISDKYKFAAVASAAKEQMISRSTGDGSGRWVQFSLNPIGDPTMEIYTETPQKFQYPTVTTNGTTVTVSTGGVSGCTITLTSLDYGKSYFQVAKNASSHSFTNVDVPYVVTITKHNYIPYVYPENVYIQNQMIDSDSYIQGRNIYVGKDVTTSKPQGNVSIKNGAHVIFEPAGEIIFDGGFECELGSTFEVKPGGGLEVK